MGTVAGLFETKDQAVKAVEALKSAGFSAEDVSLLMRDGGKSAESADAGETPDSETNATAVAAVSGGLLGSLAGLAVATGALIIPGFGPIVAAGPIAAVLTGGTIGALTGEIAVILADSGISDKKRAKHYQAGLARGGILLSVLVPDGRDAEARALLERHGLHEPENFRVSSKDAGSPVGLSGPSPRE